MKSTAIKKFASLFGVDRAVAYSLLGRGWSVLSGLISLWFISQWLSPAEQGFYYTFASVLALQVVFELGMSYVVMQFTSHEMAHLFWTPQGTLDGDEKAKSRLRSLLILVVKWYGVISLLILMVVLPVGWVFFSQNYHNSIVAWHSAWIALIFTAALNIFVIPIFSMLEGCGRVIEVAQMRMTQNVVGSCAAWFVFACEGRLLAMPVMNAVMVLVAFSWLWLKYKPLFKNLFSAHLPESHISWSMEIWPFQWRIALSWLSGYFIVQLFVPVLFFYRGAVEAGQMGMSLSIAFALISIAMAWVNTKAPTFGNLVVLKRYQELDVLFFRILWQSTFVVLLGSMVLLIVCWLLEYVGSHLYGRILPIPALALLLSAAVANHIVFAEAAYLRSHKSEPFMLLSITVGFLIAATTLLVGKQYGATGMMAGYFAVSLVVGLGWGTWIFYKKRLEWHEI